MTEHEVEKAPDVITGMAYISDKLCNILIDLGAMFSFITAFAIYIIILIV